MFENEKFTKAYDCDSVQLRSKRCFVDGFNCDNHVVTHVVAGFHADQYEHELPINNMFVCRLQAKIDAVDYKEKMR